MDRSSIEYLIPCQTMVRLWLVAGLLGLVNITGCTTMSPAIETRSTVAVVDFQRVIEETSTGKSLRESFDAFVKDRQVLLELEQQEIQKLRNDLLNQGSVLSEAARQQREEKFQRRVREYQIKEAELSRELQEKQQELMLEFRTAVKRVIATLAEERGYDMVVEYGERSSTLYHRPQLDISDEIIEAIDQDAL
ncbi:MAG: OmpH family outer membrane protein [Nitrospirales bacterium]|nr:OmpH family outer membrane protein [Nitrospira sp.]MDR4502386.1 OmpH family outer membrane protein [Nitrospirales bacterium]